MLRSLPVFVSNFELTKRMNYKDIMRNGICPASAWKLDEITGNVHRS